MRHFLIAVILTVSSLITPVLAEQVYRWTDEKGQVHFSSHPPRSLEEDVYRFRVDKAADAPPAKPAPEASAEKNNSTTKKSAESTPKIDPVKAKEYCQQARDAKTKLSANFNRRYQQEDGSVRPLTDKERADMMKRANESIQAYCQ